MQNEYKVIDFTETTLVVIKSMEMYEIKDVSHRANYPDYKKSITIIRNVLSSKTMKDKPAYLQTSFVTEKIEGNVSIWSSYTYQ